MLQSIQIGLCSFQEGSSMRARMFASLLIASAPLALLAHSVPASASAATVNRGACMSTIETWLKPYQAPGTTGLGPLTIVNGVFHYPAAFAGSSGCTL